MFAEKFFLLNHINIIVNIEEIDTPKTSKMTHDRFIVKLIPCICNKGYRGMAVSSRDPH